MYFELDNDESSKRLSLFISYFYSKVLYETFMIISNLFSS